MLYVFAQWRIAIIVECTLAAFGRAAQTAQPGMMHSAKP